MFTRWIRNAFPKNNVYNRYVPERDGVAVRVGCRWIVRAYTPHRQGPIVVGNGFRPGGRVSGLSNGPHATRVYHKRANIIKQNTYLKPTRCVYILHAYPHKTSNEYESFGRRYFFLSAARIVYLLSFIWFFFFTTVQTYVIVRFGSNARWYTARRGVSSHRDYTWRARPSFSDASFSCRHSRLLEWPEKPARGQNGQFKIARGSFPSPRAPSIFS